MKGLAGRAADAPVAAQRQDVDYALLRSDSILNRNPNPELSFVWTVNPYRGCEFGCLYCYARYTHEFLELDPTEDFDRRIFVKERAAALFERDLRSRRFRKEDPIAIGTATDPYQPAEARFGVTRAILEVAARHERLDLSITTKGILIRRDLDLLREIGRRSSLHVNMTLTTTRSALARVLEPRAPTPAARLETVRALADAGIEVGIHAMPVLPGITDSRADVEILAAAAASAGARYLGGQVLFLPSASLGAFFPFLERRFPRLVAAYRRTYGPRTRAPAGYRRRIQALYDEARTRYGLARAADPWSPPRPVQSVIGFDP